IVVAAVNTHNTTIRSEGKLAHLEQPLIPLPLPIAPQAVCDTYEEDEAKEVENVKAYTFEYDDHEMTIESEEDFKEETEDEIKEEEEDSLKHFDNFPIMKELRCHERFLKNPRPSWVKAKLDHEQKVRAKKDTIKPWEHMHFCRESQRAKSFVRNFTYECDFMVLEDTTSVIDHDLGSVIFGKPFVEATDLVYDREEETITFEKDKEKIVFKMPHKMEMFKHTDFMDIRTDHIPPLAIECNDDSSRKLTTMIA
nr:protein kinase-like domain, concanavalin A-like lectin/glucanase domain protein [Tanacetum cinerariifolium]